GHGSGDSGHALRRGRQRAARDRAREHSDREGDGPNPGSGAGLAAIHRDHTFPGCAAVSGSAALSPWFWARDVPRLSLAGLAVRTGASPVRRWRGAVLLTASFEPGGSLWRPASSGRRMLGYGP